MDTKISLTTAMDKEKFRILRSCDGKEFKVSKSIVMQSLLLANLLDLEEDGRTDIISLSKEEGIIDVIPLPEVDGITLEKIIGFLSMYIEESFQQFTAEEKKKQCDDCFAKYDIYDFLTLASAANYLGVQVVLDEACQRSADLIKNKSVEWMRKVFRIDNDYTPQEEQDVRNKHIWTYEGLDPDDDEEDAMIA
ncbi:SKP1-like protein 18 [Andrographis paniculata]|uniref:SKP1-like protein 18 n=1 Tax=Andrographis paniculata TaxID=175694 RepID=UPI0021E7D198|nr:SKP1-like protein 18 [Andrographis paniculata]